jgi:hypothetical protein
VPAPYTDILNKAIDDLTATLTAVTGLRVVNDPTKVSSKLPYFCKRQVLRQSLATATLCALTSRSKLSAAAQQGYPCCAKYYKSAATVLGSSVIVMSGRPGTLDIGGQEYPCYDLAVGMQAQTA